MAVLELHDDVVRPLLPSSSFTSPCPLSPPGSILLQEIPHQDQVEKCSIEEEKLPI